MSTQIRNTIFNLGEGSPTSSDSWQTWLTQSSVSVEDAAPNSIILTAPSARTLTKDDFSIAGKTISSGAWIGNVLTLVLSADIEPEEAISLVLLKNSGYTKVVTNNLSWSAYWTPKSLFYLDGTIITVGENKYFKDRSSAARNFLITGKDWDDSYIDLFNGSTINARGFLYKSAATISAPAGDAVLIAADINNFLYAGDGTPNQIPVVSLFQNIDYANTIYCRHQVQNVDANGIETYEPRVIEVFMTAAALSASDLTKAATYFGVPAKLTSGIREVGVGKTYATIKAAIAAASANDTIYVYSGTTKEVQGAYSLLVNKAVSVIGVGLSKVQGGGSAVIYGVVNLYGTGNQSIKGLIVDCESNVEDGVVFDGDAVKSIESCYFMNEVKYAAELGATGTHSVKNCVSKKGGIYCPAAGTRTLQGNFISQNGEYYTVYCPSGTGTLNIYYNKFKPALATATTGLTTYLKPEITYNIKWNKIDLSLVTSARAVYAEKPISLIYNTIISSNTNDKNFVVVDSTTALSGTNIKNNAINVSNTGDFSDMSIIYLKNQQNCVVDSNLCSNATTDSQPFVEIASTQDVGAPEITNNTIKHVSLNGYVIKVGTETSTANNNQIAPVITGNKIFGPYYYGDGTVGAKHVIFVGFNINPTIKYNYMSGCLIGIVLKHLGGVYATDKIYGNLIENCLNGILIKGVNGAKLYGNTIKSTRDGSIGIITETFDTETSNLVVKNNIIACVTNGIKITDGAQEGFVSDYNDIVGGNNYYRTEDKTMAAWQALGFDAHSVVTDPQLTNLIPATPITGETLDAAYDDGLDVSTVWGNISTVPSVVTKQQGASWQIGAYVQ